MNDLSQFFSLNKLPYNNSEIIPKDWVKKKIGLGFVPDEKDETNPNMYMDEMFAAGGEQPAPVCPKDNEIWYTTTDGEIYDLKGIIEMLVGMGGTYHGPAVVSNEWNDDKQMFVMTFDNDVTVLGGFNYSTLDLNGPLFMSNPEISLECKIERIIIPSSVVNCGIVTFYNCYNLSSFTYTGTINQWNAVDKYPLLWYINNPLGTVHCSDGDVRIKPNDNEIWYWGEYYDLANVISVLGRRGIPYAGPAILSNEYDGEKYVITFDGPVTKLGVAMTGEEERKSYPIFGSIDGSYLCNATHIQIPESVTDMLSYCFPVNKALQDFIIPNNVTHVDRMAFYTGEYESGYMYPIKIIISNGITYETLNNTSIDIVLANGNEVRLNLWERLTEDVLVNVVDSDGTSHEVILGPDSTYAEQGYSGYYNQSTYNSDMGEMPENFLVDNDYPVDGETIYETIEDTAEPSSDVEVIIQYEDGTSETITLSPEETYADQGCGGYYWQNWYNSNEGESSSNFLADDTYPTNSETIYDYCNDIASEDVEVTIEHEDGTSDTILLSPEETYAEQGYSGYYNQNTYDSSAAETPDRYSVDNDYPYNSETIYDYCNDIAEPDEPEPEP